MTKSKTHKGIAYTEAPSEMWKKRFEKDEDVLWVKELSPKGSYNRMINLIRSQISQAEERGYQRGLKETCIGIDKKMAEELMKEGGKTKDVLQTIIARAKQEIIGEIDKEIKSIGKDLTLEEVNNGYCVIRRILEQLKKLI